MKSDLGCFETETENSSKNATAMWLIPGEEWEQHVEEHAPAALSVARLAQFTGELGQVVPTEAGVLVGQGNGQEPFALGSAAAKLPQGQYRLANLASEPDTQFLSLLGWALGAYRFDSYKLQRSAPTLLIPASIDRTRLENEALSVWLARDLVNTPAEDMGPAALQAAVEAVGEKFGAKVDVVPPVEIETGFPLINAVGRAAAEGPRLIDLRWGPEDGRPITIVGKGVCFDSGGLNIKGGRGMALMKKDMGGAANALALAQMIMSADLPIRLRLLIPAVENAIAGNAFRPGDVFKSRSGLTVEISNTDAEGRLILADAMAYALEEDEKPAHLITLATLTGAARVALGPDLPPIYSTDVDFRSSVVTAGERVGDPVWPMPFWSRYAEWLSSSIADVDHAATSGFAGSITAGLFLKKFVPDSVPYTHVDLFAWTPSERPGRPQGGEAMAIRAIFDVLNG